MVEFQADLNAQAKAKGESLLPPAT